MTAILSEPHYLPSMEYMSVMSQVDTDLWDIESPFVKQTFRNRTYMLSPNGRQALIIPVHFKKGMPFKDVTIDYGQSWVREHWGAYYSSYGKAPFFDYYSDYLKQIWDYQHKYLIDLNYEFLSVIIKLLQWQTVIVNKSTETSFFDIRDMIKPKVPFIQRDFFSPHPYQQNFGRTFVPNLNILDLLMCQGPESSGILMKSIQTPVERFKN